MKNLLELREKVSTLEAEWMVLSNRHNLTDAERLHRREVDKALFIARRVLAQAEAAVKVAVEVVDPVEETAEEIAEEGAADES